MLTKEQTAAATKAIEMLEQAEAALAELPGDWQLAGRLRLLHPDGWSPGYLTPGDDDWWEFVPDYAEGLHRSDGK